MLCNLHNFGLPDRFSIQQPIAHPIHDVSLFFQNLIVIHRMSSGHDSKFLSHLLCTIDHFFALMATHMLFPFQILIQIRRAVIFYYFIMDRNIKTADSGVSLSSGSASRLTLLPGVFHAPDTDDRQSAQLLYAFTELDIRTSSCHGSSNRHCTQLPGFLDDRRLPEHIVGIQHIVRDFFLHQECRYDLRLRDRGYNYKNRLTGLMNTYDLL